MTLQEGEYLIPDGYTVKKVGKTLQVYKSKSRKLPEGVYRCKHCKHYVAGYSPNSGWHETIVCDTVLKRIAKDGRKLYKSANPYGKRLVDVYDILMYARANNITFNERYVS